ncbi:MAG TPA: carbohydrate ABC transporter permease, partial [Anaerolineales bacterium]|nr:carbohydrate ABC transporter permease [Anaerolineales bacterium]
MNDTIQAREQVQARQEAPTFRWQPTRLILYAILIIGAVVSIVPFFWMVSTSFMTLGETINRQWLPAVPQFKNYVEAWTEARFARYFFNSVIITATTLAGLLTTSILAGYAFGRIHFWGREFLFALLLSTMMIPESITMIPNFLFIRGDIIPLPGGSWLNSLQALTVPFMANAFSIFLLRQFFMKIPDELWDAARMDGAGHLRFLVQIVLPISKAPILTVLIFSFIASWNAFLWPLLVTTTPRWRPLMVGLWTFVSEAGPETNLLMAGAVITIIPILVLYFFTQKQFTEGIATTGLK